MDWFDRGFTQALNAVTIGMRPLLGRCDGWPFFLSCIWSSEIQFLGPSPWDLAYNGKWQLYLVRSEGPDTNHWNLFSFSPLFSGQFVSCVLFIMTKVYFYLVINLIKLLSILKTSSSVLPTHSHVVNVIYRRVLAVIYRYSGIWGWAVWTSSPQSPLHALEERAEMVCGVWSWCLRCNSLEDGMQGIVTAVPSHPTHFVQCQK